SVIAVPATSRAALTSRAVMVPPSTSKRTGSRGRAVLAPMWRQAPFLDDSSRSLRAELDTTYERIAAGHRHDSWLSIKGGGPGVSCCQPIPGTASGDTFT